MNKILIHYLKDEKGEPFACVLAKKLESNPSLFSVGWSKKNRKDKIFSKARALQIATGRAENGSNVKIPDEIYDPLHIMLHRGAKFFRDAKLAPLPEKNKSNDGFPIELKDCFPCPMISS